MKHNAEKVADTLIEACSRLDWNPHLFTGFLLQAPPKVQRMIILTMIAYLKRYQENGQNPHLDWRTDPDAMKDLEPVDLTQWDQP